jgi:histone H3/H4
MCKTAIGFEAEYFTCSVSTCNRKRTGLYFCTVPCFEAHLPTARHRDAWAEKQRAPTFAQAQAELEEEGAEPEGAGAERPSSPQNQPPPRRVVAAGGVGQASPAEEERAESETEVLIVVSKLKKYVRDRSGMNTSDAVAQVLSDHVRELCREAIRQAGQDGRRTVLDRDFTKVLAQLDGTAEQKGEGNFRSRR